MFGNGGENGARKWAAYTGYSLAIVVGYGITAYLGLQLAHTDDGVTLVWPATGFGLAALAILGVRYWPGVFLGALVVSIQFGIAIGPSTLLAAGATVALAIGAYYIRNAPIHDATFSTRRSIYAFALIPSLGATVPGAIAGTIALRWDGVLAADQFWRSGVAYWLGDAVGVFAFAPAILIAWDEKQRGWPIQTHIRPAVTSLCLLIAVAWLVFRNPLGIIPGPSAAFLIFPFLLWAAERGGAITAALSTVVVATLGSMHTVAGMGPFTQVDIESGAMLLWLFIAACAMASFLFATMEAERRRGRAKLEENTVFLSGAARMAKLGGWELDAISNRVTWTEETFRIHELPVTDEPPLDDAIAFYDAADQETLTRALESALESGEEYDLTLGFTTAKGNHRWVRAICHPWLEQGKVTKLLGTFQDVTDQVEADRIARERESTYRLLAENVRDIIWTTDLDLNFTYISPSVEHVRGYTPEESMEMGPIGATSPETVEWLRSVAKQLVEAALSSDDFFDSTVTVDIELKRKDGSTFPAEVVVSVLRDDGGSPVGLLGITRDITERVRSEKSLRDSEARLRTAGRMARLGGWEYNVTEGTVHWNEETYRIFERPLDYIPPKPADSLKFYDEADRIVLQRALERAITEEKPFDLELRVTTVNGTRLWVRNIGEPLVEDGRVASLRGTIQDITSTKEAESTLHLYKEVITNSTDTVMVTEASVLEEPGPRIVFVNEAFTEMTGYSAEEAVGHSPRFLQGPETSRVQLDRIRQALEACQSCSAELVNYRKDGTPYWVELNLAPVRNDGGHPKYFIAIERDITDRKRNEAERQELGARAAAIVESALDGIITIDEAGTIESVNQAARSLFGYEQGELSGRPITTLMPSPYREEHDGYIARYLRTGERRIIGSSRRVEGLCKDGSVIPIMLSVGEAEFQGRRLFTGTVHDLSHESELEEQLRQSQKMEALGTLAGGISHDFNNILHSMMGFSGIAQRAVEDGDLDLARRSIQEIEKGSVRAADLVEQILTFSRQAKVELHPVSLGDEIAEVYRFISGSKPDLVKSQLHVDREELVVMGDATQLHQLVQNLATNAIHAMEEDGGHLEIHVDKTTVVGQRDTRTGPLEPGEYGRLRVIDSGKGIPEDVLERVLDPFFTTKEKGKGTGLGLATVHGIVTRMGGGLDIHSELGVGTEVSAFLPLIEAAPVETAQAEHLGHEAIDVSGTILVVDDESSVVELLRLVLEAKGIAVDGFVDPDEAIAACKDNPGKYALAILDYNMPTITGLEVARRLRAIRRNLPVCLATGMIEKAAAEAETTDDINEILKKPFRTEDLLNTLYRLLS